MESSPIEIGCGILIAFVGAGLAIAIAVGVPMIISHICRDKAGNKEGDK